MATVIDQHSGGQTAAAVDFVLRPDADLALISLDRSVSATYSPLTNSHDAAPGRPGQIYGWGATCTDQPEIECQSRQLKYANVTVTEVGGGCPDSWGGWGICIQRGDGITADGDSGGPLFANGRQVGVASTGNRVDRATYTELFPYRGWITKVAGV